MKIPLDRHGDPIPEILLPTGLWGIYRRPRFARFVAKHFNRVYYANCERTMFSTSWLGTTAVKYPTDMWVYQQIIAEQRPELIIETGTYRGGSALFLASVCELLGHGEVITIDIHDDKDPPGHPRITHMIGSSVAPDVVAAVTERAAGRSVLVILDSDHSCDHVLAELRAYCGLVRPGDSLVVEDTNVNGHPVLPSHGPGPFEAVQAFLAENDDFVRDRNGERYLLTANPDGFLRRRVT